MLKFKNVKIIHVRAAKLQVMSSILQRQEEFNFVTTKNFPTYDES